MEEKICSGDCLKCSMQQRVYCSSQRSYAILENQRVIMERLNDMQHKISLLTEKDIIPLGGAQSGDGAEE